MHLRNAPVITPPAQRYPKGYPVYIPKLNQTQIHLAHKFASSGGAQSVANMLERLADREEVKVIIPTIGASVSGRKPIGALCDEKKETTLHDEEDEMKECITYLL
ncbi:hypothetical protein OESDEN_12084 [Oesophagostomum dentatum]|uniref:Uncharacterized protein n=1 Tax=Oesophagostomum dentatum TaxID=61180 RepID=A0A0B1SYA5_OESDE|nr:hypothetical protein OESDEN_12084 [Oesophagostomum dentatum]